MLIRSISGLRGTVGIGSSGLTPEVVSRYAAAFATYAGNKNSIAIGYDGRSGGDLFYRIAIEAVRAAGCGVLTLGIVPTPTVQLAAEYEPTVAGGIAITASHNPEEWNGMKFLDGTGLFLDAEQNARLWDIHDTDKIRYSETAGFGEVRDGAYIVDKHIEAVLGIGSIDIEAIRRKKFRVVVDAVNASGSKIQPRLLKALGVAEIIEIACDSSGKFPHRPEPIPQNLGSLGKAVLKYKADLGIAVDPDADRLVLYMENGEPFIEENTIVLAAEQVLKHSPNGQTVVVNLSTTRAVEDVAEEHRAQVVRTAVGEINVAKKMQELGAIVGGEGSGGIILPSVHLGRDSLVGVALALGALAEFDGSISEKRAAMPQYEIRKSKIDLRDRAQVDTILAELEAKYKGGKISKVDGLRVDIGKTWLHARASNTEPIIRFIAEAPTAAEAEQLLEENIKAYR